VKNHELGEKILTGLGGSENIAHFTHCATRLRVTPADRSKVNTEQIKSIPGVLSVIEQSGQTQVVLGDRVEGVYNEMQTLPGMANLGEDNAGSKKASEGKKAGWLTNIFDVLSDSFRPLLWALLGTSDRVLAAVRFLRSIHRPDRPEREHRYCERSATFR